MARQVRARCFILLLFSTTSCHQVLGCRRTCRDADALLALQPRRIERRRLLDQIGRHRGVIAHFAWQVRVGAVPSAHHQHQIRDGGRASHGRALIASADRICQTATGGGFRLPSIKFRELQRDNAGKREYPGLLRSSTIKFDSDQKRARGRMPHVRQLVRVRQAPVRAEARNTTVTAPLDNPRAGDSMVDSSAPAVERGQRRRHPVEQRQRHRRGQASGTRCPIGKLVVRRRRAAWTSGRPSIG